MLTRQRVLRGGAVLLLLLLMGALALGDSPKERLVTADLREAKIDDALRMVLRSSPDSLVVAPGALQQGQKVSLNLKAVPVSTAVRLICSAAGVVGMRSREGVWQITAPQAMIRVNNQSVPIIGAVQVGSNNQLGAANLPPEVLQQLPSEAVANLAPPPAPAQRRPGADIQEPVGGDPLVNLQVANAPIPEALAKLRDSSGLDVVAVGVPEKTRITARVYMMPFTQFLGELAEQAGLAVQWVVVSNDTGKPRPLLPFPGGPQRRGVLDAEQEHYRYYVVPFPMISISGRPQSAPGKGRQVYTDFPVGEQDLVDLAVTDATLAQAVAKLSGSCDVVASEAIPSQLRISVKAYRVPAEWLFQQIAQGAGLELREQMVDKEGKPAPSSGIGSLHSMSELTERYHTRYYLVPRSELKVIGSAGRVVGQGLAFAPQARGGRPGGPVHLDPSGFVVGLLEADPGRLQGSTLVR